MKKIFAALATVLLLTTLSGCITITYPSSSSESQNSQRLSSTPVSSATVSQTNSSAASSNSIPGLNESATYKNTKITVTGINKSSGSDFDKPKDGMEYVVVTVKYENVSASATISYNPYDFKMQNSKGQITDKTFSIIDTDTALSSGDLAPGGEIEGTIVFEQPKNDAGLILIFTGSIFSDSTKLSFKIN